MALILRKTLFERAACLIETKRFRGKINFRRPKPPHFERSVYIELTKPYFISPYKDKTTIELCRKPIENKMKDDGDNPFQRIVAGELANWFKSSRLVAFYHQNPMAADEQYKAYVLFKREKMHYKNYGRKTLEMAITGTKFEPVLDFYVSQNMTVFSTEPEILKLLKITKKFPQLVLLAAIFEGQFISKDELLKYSLIPNLQTAQSELVQTLNSAGSNLVSQLNTNQNSLISQLQQREKQLEE